MRSSVVVTTDQVQLFMHTCDGCRSTWWTDDEGRNLRSRRAAGLIRGASERPVTQSAAANGRRRP